MHILGDTDPHAYQPWELFDEVVTAQLAKNPNALALQVGANDGQRYDPLFHHIVRGGLTAVLLEPHPLHFDRLRILHARRAWVTPVQTAIGQKPGEELLWYVQPHSSLPDRVAGMAGFNREVIAKQASVPDLASIEDHIASVLVKTVTYADFLAAHELPNPDIVVIDTEGTDWEIAQQVLAAPEAGTPEVLMFEHEHLPPSVQADSRAVLGGLGYMVATSQNDTLAYR